MKIFISYRRDDSAGYAGRLFDHLAAHFGARNVFMDIDTIEPGDDFRKVVQNAVGTCDVVLILIGKQWLSITDAQGRRRLDDPLDWVRMEIANALANSKVRTIPVLVRDAAMPGEHELPEGLKELTWRNAIELSDSRFQHDVKKLIGVIERMAVQAPVEPPLPSPTGGSQKRWIVPFFGGILGLAVLVFLIWMFRNSLTMAATRTPTPEVMFTATNILIPTWTPTTLSGFVTLTPDPNAIPSPPEVTNDLVKLIDDYYTCINTAAHDHLDDYEICWNMLSNRQGEFQDNLTQNSGGKDAFIDYWNKYKVSYALYYCFNQGEHFVDAEYYHHDWDNLAKTVGGTNLLEYSFALGSDGWRIARAKVLSGKISSYCESQPRVDKRSLFP